MTFEDYKLEELKLRLAYTKRDIRKLMRHPHYGDAGYDWLYMKVCELTEGETYLELLIEEELSKQ